MGREIRFVVYGEARPESKRTAPARPGKDGGIVQGRRYEPADRRSWKADVRRAAAEALCGPPMEGPVHMTVWVEKPPAPSWPKRPTKANPWPWAWWKKFDRNNLVKPIEDALKSVVWLDDGQVVASKEWKIIGDRHATVVVVREVTEDDASYQRAVMEGIMCGLQGGCGADTGGLADAIVEGLMDAPEAELDDEDAT